MLDTIKPIHVGNYTCIKKQRQTNKNKTNIPNTAWNSP